MEGGIESPYDCVKPFYEIDFTGDLKKMTLPTLVLDGDGDRIVSIADLAPLAAKILPKATLVGALVVLFVLALRSTPAVAASSPPQAPFDSITAADVLSARYSDYDAMTELTARTGFGSGERGGPATHRVRVARLAVWRERTRTVLVALVDIELDRPLERSAFRAARRDIVILGLANGRLARVAQLDGPIFVDSNDRGVPTFDFVPFRPRPDEPLVGLRQRNVSAGERVELSLFGVRDGVIRVVGRLETFGRNDDLLPNEAYAVTVTGVARAPNELETITRDELCYDPKRAACEIRRDRKPTTERFRFEPVCGPGVVCTRPAYVRIERGSTTATLPLHYRKADRRVFARSPFAVLAPAFIPAYELGVFPTADPTLVDGRVIGYSVSLDYGTKCNAEACRSKTIDATLGSIQPCGSRHPPQPHRAERPSYDYCDRRAVRLTGERIGWYRRYRYGTLTSNDVIFESGGAVYHLGGKRYGLPLEAYRSLAGSLRPLSASTFDR